MKKFFVVHPSRGRPKFCQETISNHVGNLSGQNTFLYTLCCDQDDPELPLYREISVSMKVNLVVGDNSGCVQATNRACSKDVLDNYDIIVITSDDIREIDSVLARFPDIGSRYSENFARQVLASSVLDGDRTIR